jgi:5-methylcytosine-specific restriction protein A
MKLCTICGVRTSRQASRCTEHARQSNRSRHNALHSTRAWQRLSPRVHRAWRGQHGDWCPGYQRDAHPASDLTVDHVVPLAAGGRPLDFANCAVLCRSCNSTKGASTDGGGVAHESTPLLAGRASRMCARGRVSREIPDLAVDAEWRRVRPRAPQGPGWRPRPEVRLAVPEEVHRPQGAVGANADNRAFGRVRDDGGRRLRESPRTA